MEREIPKMAEGQTSKGKRHTKKPSTPKVILYMKSQDGDILGYRLGRDKEMQYLFTKYCNDRDLDSNAVVFLYDGRRVKVTSTPSELGMENGDEIDVMVHQEGGYSCKALNLLSNHKKN